MATEYGVRSDGIFGGDTWWGPNREPAEDYVRGHRQSGLTLIAREVSEPRIVSIRA